MLPKVVLVMSFLLNQVLTSLSVLFAISCCFQGRPHQQFGHTVTQTLQHLLWATLTQGKVAASRLSITDTSGAVSSSTKTSTTFRHALLPLLFELALLADSSLLLLSSDAIMSTLLGRSVLVDYPVLHLARPTPE